MKEVKIMSDNKKKPMRQINFEIDHTKEAFYSNDFGISVSNIEIVLDFRQTLPRIDIPSKGNIISSMAVKHNPIIMPPKTAKMLIALLKENIERYEKEYGEIKLPKKWRGKAKQVISVTGSEKLGYIG